jgi:hypothetical protein
MTTVTPGGMVTANGTILSQPVMSPGARPEVTRAPLPIHGVAPGLRDAVERAGIPVPPEPTTPAPDFRQLAEQQRQSLMRDREWVAKYQNGDVAARQQMETVCRILGSRGASEEELEPLAKFAGISKPPTPPPAPPPSDPMAFDTKPSDFRVDPRSGSPEVVTAAREWASKAGFQSGLGSAVLERIAQTNGALAKLSPDALLNWDARQAQLLIDRHGVDEAKQLVADARRFRTELAADGAPDAPVWGDAWLTETAARRWRSHAQARGIK